MQCNCKNCDDCPFPDCIKTESSKPNDPEYYKKYYYKNREKILKYQKEYRKKHPNMQYEANKKWKEKNREHVNELQRAYRKRKKMQTVNI